MPLDDADKKAIAEMIAGALKPEALTAALQPLVASAVTAATKPLTERLDKGEQAAKAAEAEAAKKAAEAEAAKKAAAEEEAKKASGGKPAEPDPAIMTQLRQLQEQLKAERDARAAAEARTAQEALNRTLRDAIAAAGIPADRIKHALAVIQAEGAIVDHQGAPHWKGKVGGVDGIHALADGLADWAKNDGKIFLPPAPVKGSGSEPGQRTTQQAGGAPVDWSKLGGAMSLRGINN